MANQQAGRVPAGPPTFKANAKTASIVAGARVPIVLTGRTGSARP